MSKKLMFLICVVSLLALVGNASAQSCDNPVVLLAGDVDDCGDFNEPIDITSRRPIFDAAVRHEVNNRVYHGGNPREFDIVYYSVSGNHTFGHTFENLPQIDVTQPVILEIGFCADYFTMCNDGLSLQKLGNDPCTVGPFAWGRPMNEVFRDFGGTGDWCGDDRIVATYDLRLLPQPGQPLPDGNFDLVTNHINNVHYLDIFVQDDTGVNYIRLTYCVCDIFEYRCRADVKWSQPPRQVKKGIINGWDEVSSYDNSPIVADDWLCVNERPIKGIHWWGSFKGWTECVPPEEMPDAFHIGIWTDVPDTDPYDLYTFSHPGELVWEKISDCHVWSFAGYDLDPRGIDQNDACFKFDQLLSQDEWFYQEANGGTHTLIDGTKDNFVGPEPSSPRPQLIAVCNRCKGFDNFDIDRHFGHTISGLCPNICSATLEIRLKAIPGQLATCNDVISLQTTGGTPAFAWSRRIGTRGPGYWCDGPDGLLTDPWLSGNEHTFVFNLAALPLVGGGKVSIINLINGDQALDIRVQDDTAVDYVKLTVTCGTVYWLSIAAIYDDGSASCWLVDDFESYTDTPDLLNAWQALGGGASLFLSKDPNPHHFGDQAMGFTFANYYIPYYSEGAFTPAERDWTARGVKVLDLWFKGEMYNPAEQMYVVLEDTVYSVGVVKHPDTDAVLKDSWQQWCIDLADPNFAAVDLNNVNKLYIGFGDRDNPSPADANGTVYIDDIRLCNECPNEPYFPFPWGWKTRPHFYNDDAVRIHTLDGGEWPPAIGSVWESGEPIQYPEGTSWDMAFVLTANRKYFPRRWRWLRQSWTVKEELMAADVYEDGRIDFKDIAISANYWLEEAVWP